MLYHINWLMLTKESITYTNGDRNNEGRSRRVYLQNDESQSKDSTR
jgi:hypothetical protein